MTDNSRVLVLGASGFIGGHVASVLRNAGLEVVGASTTGSGADLACDLLDPAATKEAIESTGVSHVVMAAGNSSVKSSWDDPPACFRSNTETVFNLLEALRPLGESVHLTLLSSATVYGAPASAGSLPFTEESPTHPVSPYGAAKLAAETHALQYARQYGIRTAILRLFNQLGPGQGISAAPAEFARQIAVAEKSGQPKLLLPVGSPHSQRDFTDVRDAALGVSAVLESQREGTFNLCSGTKTSISEIVQGLDLATELDVVLDRQPERAHPEDVTEIYGDGGRLREATGWLPTIGLERSLADMVADWRDQVSPG